MSSMLVARRVSSFQRAVKVLSQCVHGIEHLAAQKHINSFLKATAKAPTKPSLATTPRAVADPLVDKLLFRTIPISLSLVERAMVGVKGGPGRQSGVRPPLLLPPTMLEPLFSSLHTAEAVRRRSLQEKLAELSLAEARGSVQVEELGRRVQRLRRVARWKCDKKGRQVAMERSGNEEEGETNSSLADVSALMNSLQEEKAKCKAEVASHREDAQMLHQSLVGRSYLSARLWRFLLHEGTWLAFLSQQRQRKEGDPFGSVSSPLMQTTSSSLLSPTAASSVAKEKSNNDDHAAVLWSNALIRVLWCWSRVVVGLLHDVVRMGRPFSAFSPRFVVSLPSRQRRRRRSASRATYDSKQAAAAVSSEKETTPAGSSSNSSGGDGSVSQAVGGMRGEVEEGTFTALDSRSAAPAMDQFLMSSEVVPSTAAEMRAQASQRSSSPSSTRNIRKRKTRKHAARRDSDGHISLGWMPPNFNELPTLLMETLGLWRILLDHLADSSSISPASIEEIRYTEVRIHISQLLQVLVAVQQVATTTLLLSSGDTHDAVIGRVLSELEHVLLRIIGQVRECLCERMQERAPHHERGGLRKNACQTPIEAARLLVNLNCLHALSPSSLAARSIVFGYCLEIFPQLRTNTWQALLSKAKESSLLAFVGASHRKKLRRSGVALSSLLESPRHRSRLEQRQLAAAMRAAHLSDVQRNTLLDIADTLDSQELVALLKLLASHVASAEGGIKSSGPAHPHTRRRPAGGVDERHQRDTVLMAALLVGEATLVKIISTSSDEESESISSVYATSVTESFTLKDLADVWVALTVLKPAVDVRRRISTCSVTASFSSETQLWNAVAVQVLHSLQGQLVVFTEAHGSAEETTKGMNIEESKRLATGLHAISVAIVKWGQERATGTQSTFGVGASATRPMHSLVYREVYATGRLIKDILMQRHRALENVFRTAWSREARENFASSISECMNILGLSDRAVESIVCQL